MTRHQRKKVGNFRKNLTFFERKYWDGRGLMEVPRCMLAIAGHFPGAGYADVRFGEDAPKTGTDANLGRLPVLEHDGKVIGQSAAINYFVASVTGLLGSSTAEAAQIIAFGEHIKELKDAYRALVPYGTEPKPEAITAFFEDATASDFTGAADGSKRKHRNLLWFLGRMEHLVGDGFAVGNKISLADVLLFNALADTLTDKDVKGEVPVYNREPFGSLARTNAVLAKHPKLAKIVHAVAAHPNIVKWMATRGQQEF
jgi:glutathione S-transferase